MQSRRKAERWCMKPFARVALFVGVTLVGYFGNWCLAEEPKERAILTGHTATPWCVAFSRDGATLASGGDDKGVKLWEVKTGKNTATLETNSSIGALAF